MRRLTMLGLGVLVLTAAVLAANVHFVRGPVILDAGVILVVEGKLAGLGEGDVTILVTANGIGSVECTNPGGNVAPGQDTAVTASGSVTLPAAKNGNLVFAVATDPPPQPPATPTCPNDQWSADIIDVAFTDGLITVVQGGQVVLSTPF